MALYERDYDRPYRRTYREGGISHWSRSGAPLGSGYGGDFGYGSRSSRESWDPYTYDTGYRYGEDYLGQPYSDRGYDRGYDLDFDRGYDRGTDLGYDQGFKSRWQTDYGDPYGDRVQQTPIRVIQGRPGYDQPFRYRGSSDRFPMGYQPWNRRMGYDTGYQTERRDWQRSWPRSGYDRGWY